MGDVRQATVFIVDDDPAVRESLRWLLGSEQLNTRTFASGREFLSAYQSDWHGVITLDVRMPVMNGLELQQRLTSSGNQLPIIIITGHADVAMAIRAMKAGAFDFLEKPYSDQDVLACIGRAIAHDRLRVQQQAERSDIIERMQALTSREREVMQLVVAGKANKVIAAELSVSEKTVEVHRARVMRKMQAESLSHLVKLALQSNSM